MDIPTIVLLALSVTLLFIVYLKAPQKAVTGLRTSAEFMIEIVPRLVAALLLVGVLQALVPPETIARWMGQRSGLRGILIGTVLGTVTPGGPMTHFPVVGALYKAGVGIGPLVAYLTAWSLFGIQRIVMWELPFLGTRVLAVRVASSFFFPVLAGWLSGLIFARFRT